MCISKILYNKYLKRFNSFFFVSLFKNIIKSELFVFLLFFYDSIRDLFLFSFFIFAKCGNRWLFFSILIFGKYIEKRRLERR